MPWILSKSCLNELVWHRALSEMKRARGWISVQRWNPQNSQPRGALSNWPRNQIGACIQDLEIAWLVERRIIPLEPSRFLASQGMTRGFRSRRWRWSQKIATCSRATVEQQLFHQLYCATTGLKWISSHQWTSWGWGRSCRFGDEPKTHPLPLPRDCSGPPICPKIFPSYLPPPLLLPPSPHFPITPSPKLKAQ
jgi:hypothetical protein